jgi:hypothetical protein
MSVGGVDPSGNLDESETWDGTNWTEGNNLNTARRDMDGVGITTAGLIVGGYSTAVVAICEAYNGTSWSETDDLNTARMANACVGTSTATLTQGGHPPSDGLAITETYDGSSWTEVGDTNTIHIRHAGSGTTSAATMFGGAVPPGEAKSAQNESWDGTAWTEAADLSVARDNVKGGQAGTLSAGLCFGGLGPPGARAANTEEWNFSSTLAAGAWASGGNLNTGRSHIGGMGINTAAVAVGGSDGPGPSPATNAAEVEEYDGTSWTEVTNMPTATKYVASGGILTAGWYGGGDESGDGTTLSDKCFEYDGTNWTAGGDLTQTKNTGAGTGTQTTALITAGTPNSLNCMLYDGSSWTETADISTSRLNSLACGNSSAAIVVGGYSPPASAYTANTESWNGTSWTEVNNLNVARSEGGRGGNGVAPSDSALFMGAYGVPSPTARHETESWDGTSWSVVANLATGRGSGGGAVSSNTVGLLFGGYMPNTTWLTATEEWTVPQNVKTITD